MAYKKIRIPSAVAGLSPLEKAALRTGACQANGVNCDCLTFVPNGYMDHFHICSCGHTQHAHEFSDEVLEKIREGGVVEVLEGGEPDEEGPVDAG